MPTVDSSSSESSYEETFTNCLGLEGMNQHTSSLSSMGDDLPVWLFSPLALVPDDVDNLSIDLVLSRASVLCIHEDITSSFYPDGIAKARRKFDEYLLVVGQSAGVQIVTGRSNDACNRLSGGEAGRGSRCFFGCSLNITLGTAHADNGARE